MGIGVWFVPSTPSRTRRPTAQITRWALWAAGVPAENNTRTFLFTVHGIGAYDAAKGASGRLVDALDGDLRAALEVVDFNWHAAVERREFQDKLNCAVNGLPAGAHVILAGHSLGSVIALDSLCNSGAWNRFDSVSFVTAGSPIFRFFQRFFPGLFFPREAGGCCSRIQSRSRVIRWLNVYRTGRPVRRRLFHVHHERKP